MGMGIRHISNRINLRDKHIKHLDVYLIFFFSIEMVMKNNFFYS